MAEAKPKLKTGQPTPSGSNFAVSVPVTLADKAFYLDLSPRLQVKLKAEMRRVLVRARLDKWQ